MSKSSPVLKAGRPSAKNDKSAALSSLGDKVLVKRVNFDLNATQHAKLKIYAVQRNKTIKEVLTEFVEELSIT